MYQQGLQYDKKNQVAIYLIALNNKRTFYRSHDEAEIGIAVNIESELN